MKLLVLSDAAGSRLGLATDAGVVDVPATAAALGVKAPATIEALFQDYERGHEALLGIQSRLGRGGAVMGAGKTSAPPVARPGKIIAIGLNYHAHARECNLPVPETPVVFAKFPSTLVGTGAEVEMPIDDPKLDYEAELAIVIGRRARRISGEQALNYVAGYLNANDISARGLQFRSPQWVLGKTCDGFCPVGPFLVTADEVGDPARLSVRCEVNGVRRQTGQVADMIFSCQTIIEYLTRYMTLEPGDIILTGTPPGVAVGQPEPVWLRPGDVVAVEIDGLGRLENRIVPPGASS